MMKATLGAALLLFVWVCTMGPPPVSAFWSVYSGWTGGQLPPEDVMAIRLHQSFQTVRGIPVPNINWFAKSVVERWNAAKKSPLRNAADGDVQRLLKRY